jgi:hypothetical protein
VGGDTTEHGSLDHRRLDLAAGFGQRELVGPAAAEHPEADPPRAEAIEERMTRPSAAARAAPTWPLSWIVVSDTFARRWCSAAGSALAPKLASPTVTIVEVRMASSRLAGSRRADRSRRSTNDARAPRALTADSGPGGGRSMRSPRLLLMIQTLRTDGRITSAGREWLRVWRAIVAGTQGAVVRAWW